MAAQLQGSTRSSYAFIVWGSDVGSEEGHSLTRIAGTHFAWMLK